MNCITRLCLFISVLSVSNFAMPSIQTEQKQTYKALIFLSSTREIYETRPFEQIAPTTFLRWVIACAADSEPEETFNQNSFLERKTLFVETIVEQSVVGFGSQCNKPFQITAAYHSSETELQFGYEVYYNTSKFGGFEDLNDKSIRSIKQHISVYFPFKDSIQQAQLFNNLTLNDVEKTKLDFLWVPRIHLQHDYKSWNPKIIRYKMLKTFPGMLQQCNDYQLANDYFGSVIVDSFYNQENQRQILQGVDTSLFPQKFKCGLENETCLTKWQLIPPNQINFYISAPKTCSNLTTVPIWSKFTQIPLENLQIFLQAMIRRLGDSLDITITTGKALVSSSPPNPIYMDKENNRIPIPTTIQFLIKYKIPYCKKSGDICDQAIIIVIHNDPNFDPKDQLCPEKEDLCQILGWSWIQYEDTDTESDQKWKYDNIYCCKPIDSMLEKLEPTAENQPQTKYYSLDLRHFPLHDKKNEKVEWTNLENLILKEIKNMKKWNGEVSSQETSSPKQNYNSGENQFAEGGSPQKSKSFDFAATSSPRKRENMRIDSSP